MQQQPMTQGTGGYAYQIVQEPMQVLAEAQSAFVKQQTELFEMLSGYEMPNCYDVFVKNSVGAVCHLFRAKECSGCCQRQFCNSESRAFKLRFKHVTAPGMQVADDFLDDFGVFDRPFACTCYCCDRPKMTGYYKSVENGEQFGQITEPCTYCNPLFLITTGDRTPSYQIHCDCCQCGMMCRKNICGVCSEVIFGIYPAEVTDFNSQNMVGQVKKISKGAMELFSDADSYQITFPMECSPEEKLLIIGTTMMIDYRYFEQTQNKPMQAQF